MEADTGGLPSTRKTGGSPSATETGGSPSASGAGSPSTRVEIIDCAKTFADGTRALKPTSLTVEPGEVLALLGPSGCGKTTLLRVIAGLESADAGGRVLFGAEDVTARPIETRGVGMVFQHYALFPQMTAAANIGYGLKIRGVGEAEKRRRVGELVDLVRLNGLEHKRPAELSGGQRQRVALARAVAVRPRVLLLDEPLTALDAKLKESLRDELAELLRRLHITAIHVTHDQQEALAIADRLAIMQAGRIVGLGDGETLYRNPTHPFVTEFLGRVNRIERDETDRVAGRIRLGDAAWPCPPALRDSKAVLVRPEDVDVGPPTAGSTQMMVARRVFLGERVQLHLRPFDAKLESDATRAVTAALIAEVARDHSVTRGETVSVSINADRWMPWYEEKP
jgi:putative spermidine/putrescine transport system ATP-binding protein